MAGKFEPLTLENMKVFEVCEEDWVAAPSMETARDWYIQETGIEPDDLKKPIKEISLDFKVAVDGEPTEKTFKITLREDITERIGLGFTEPYVVASTEY